MEVGGRGVGIIFACGCLYTNTITVFSLFEHIETRWSHTYRQTCGHIELPFAAKNEDNLILNISAELYISKYQLECGGVESSLNP